MNVLNNVLVVIPARGGSQRIPNKNVKEIFGQPMIYWPLMELRKIFSKDNVLISTDSKLIKDYAEKKGLSIPFMRPKSLSDNFTGTVPVVQHALKWYETNVKKVDFVLTVYPTAVLLNIDDIHGAITTLADDDECDSIMSAKRFNFPIQRAVREDHFGYAVMFYPEHYSTRSQDLIEAKHDAGQFYLSRADSVRRGDLITNSKVKLQILHRNNAVDIDTLEDFEIAEEKLFMRKKNSIDHNWTF